jgi:hypothetical protein
MAAKLAEWGKPQRQGNLINGNNVVCTYRLGIEREGGGKEAQSYLAF